MSQRYQFEPRDAELLWAANVLLRKVMGSGKIRPVQMVTLAKLQHILSVLPRVTEGVSASVSVSCPRQKFGDVETWHWWEFGVEEDQLKISSGGHFYRPSTGGDSFTTMTWAAVPVFPTELNDYRESLLVVPDVRSFSEGVESIDFATKEYSIEILDEDNHLLDGGVEEEDDNEEPDLDPAETLEANATEQDESSPVPWSMTPVDASDNWAASLVHADLVNANEPNYNYGADGCGICGTSLDQHGFHVDGRLHGELMWSNMCMNCFKLKGEGIGWGKGQLYARQTNGDWRLVAGFRPDVEEPM